VLEEAAIQGGHDLPAPVGEPAANVDRASVHANRDALAMSNAHDVQGIVLAGVHSWGDCVLERAVCRPLLPVADAPLVGHVLGWLLDSGIPNATICANSDTSALKRRLGGAYREQLSLSYFEDVMPRGPAGCMRDAAQHCTADRIVVVDGTLVPRIDLNAILEHHDKTHAAVTLVVTESDAGRGHEPLGVYVFSRAVLEGVPATGYQDIKESLIPSLYRSGARISTYVARGVQCPRVTDAASYLGVNMWATERTLRDRVVPKDFKRVGDALVHESAKVDASARFVGPVIVGPNAIIEREAVIVGPATIGAASRIDRGAMVSRSAVWDRCHVGEEAIVDQCVLSDGTAVAAGLVMRETVCVASQGGRRRGLFGRK
jgi:NDP-sugar pyrophosphorylase family protein